MQSTQKKLQNEQKLLLYAERQGFEPWQRLRVDRLAICSITTLAPLQYELELVQKYFFNLNKTTSLSKKLFWIFYS